MPRKVILCVDDEKFILETLERQISKSSVSKTHEIEIAESAEEALDIISELDRNGDQLAVLVSDQIMPGMKGDELLTKVNETHPDTLKILLTGQASLDAIKNAINSANLYRYISKPWNQTDFTLTIEEAAKSYQQHNKIIEFDSQNKTLKLLNHTAHTISEEMNMEKIVNKLLHSVVTYTKAERVYFILKKDRKFRVIHFLDEDEDNLKSAHLESAENIVTWNESILDKVIPLTQKNQPAGYQMVAEMYYKDEVLGFLFAENPYSKRPFDHNQFEILKMLELHGSSSYENARLYSSIEETNRDIMDSIGYAKRIQNSLLPGRNILEKYFKDYFIIYEPKDVVSGDFYWFAEERGYFFLAVVDCTGHGVPGAFMSVLGSTQLTEIVRHNQITDPAEVLSELHQRINYTLGKNQPDVKVYDGMDLSLLRFDYSLENLEYVGANRPMLLIRERGVMEIPGDKKPIGHTGPYNDESGKRVYTKKTVRLRKGDEIYVFSDGFTDEFGADTGKKFGKKRLIQTLLELNRLPFTSRGAEIEKIITEWRGNQPSIDDRVMIGIRK